METRSKKVSLSTKLALGFFLGIVAGLLSAKLGISPAFFDVIGKLFIRLISMVVVPLVLATIIVGASSIENISKLGRIATKTLVYYFLTTGLAVAIGLIFANLMSPGVGLSISTEGLVAKQVTAPSISEVFLNIVPMNPIGAINKADMLQVIVFAIFLGFGISAVGERARPLQAVFDGIAEVMLKVTNIVMYYAPIGVFGLIASTVYKQGAAVLLPLIKVICVMYIASLVHICVCYLSLLKLSGLKLSVVCRLLAAPFLIAFTTCSSAAALSANLVQVQKLGASKHVSALSIPLGNTINMDGTAVYMGVVAIFVAEIYGISIPFDKQLQIILIGVLASIGTVGVPGAGLIMSSIVFTQVGIPLEGIAIIAGIDRVMDMARTTLNVIGDATGALVISKSEGELDLEQGEQSLQEESA